MMFRSARSFMSTTRFQTIRRGSMPRALPWWMWLSKHRRQQVVGQFDGVEIAGEVEVDVLHGHDLGVAAAGRAAFHAEARPQRRLAEADAGPLADAVQPVAQADARRRLALAGGRRRDRGHQDQLARRLVIEPMDTDRARPWPCTCRNAPDRRRGCPSAWRSRRSDGSVQHGRFRYQAAGGGQRLAYSTLAVTGAMVNSITIPSVFTWSQSGSYRRPLEGQGRMHCNLANSPTPNQGCLHKLLIRGILSLAT